METKERNSRTINVNIKGDVMVIDVKGMDPITFSPTGLPANVRLEAEMRGWKQRLENGAALERDAATGLPATAEEKYEGIRALVDYYLGGATEWERPRQGGKGGRRFDIGAVVVAMMRASGVDIEVANRRIDGLATKRGITREEAAKIWAKTPEVALAMAEIAAEGAPAGANDLLAEIEGA